MSVNIKPSKLSGEITLLPSKSESHRALICAALSGGCVKNLNLCEDVLATLDGLKSMGAKFTLKDGVAVFEKFCSKNAKDCEIHCKKSASTLRFLIPLFFAFGKKGKFVCDPSLLKRPLDCFEETAKENGILFLKSGNELTVWGKIKNEKITVSGEKSSQFLSGFLMAAPLLNAKIVLKGGLNSAPYVDLTRFVLENFGVYINHENGVYSVSGDFKKGSFTVNADLSAAAYLDAFNFTGGNVVLKGLPENTVQGDKIFKQIFSDIKSGKRDFCLENCPDLAPVVLSVAAITGGEYNFSGVERLKFKESNRIEEIKKTFTAFGVMARYEDGIFKVMSNGLKKPQKVLDFSLDHRIIMAQTLLCSVTGGEIANEESVKKSYVTFFEDLNRLGLDATC